MFNGKLLRCYEHSIKLDGIYKSGNGKGICVLPRKYLREKGIIAALDEKGIKEGDTVRVYDMEFTYYR